MLMQQNTYPMIFQQRNPELKPGVNQANALQQHQQQQAAQQQLLNLQLSQQRQLLGAASGQPLQPFINPQIYGGLGQQAGLLQGQDLSGINPVLGAPQELPVN